MSWSTYLDREIAERVCSNNELQVLILKHGGYGRRTGSRLLGISESAWRYRMENAVRKINTAKRKAA